MLFDETDFNMFPSEDSKRFFRDILQTYYSQNYRATIVLLYSFLIYDLFEKIKVMANDGNGDARRIQAEVATDFTKDEKFSEIEKKILDYFSSNFSSYFKNFEQDIEYLVELRHKCAHLNLTGSSLFVPKEYQVRMLICSMFDNVFSVRAPFITDLFSFVQPEIGTISSGNEPINDELYERLSNLHFARMTDDSIKKSLFTFYRLVLYSTDADAIKNIHGLTAFCYSLSKYALNRGLENIFSEKKIHDLIIKLNYEEISSVPERTKAFKFLITNISEFEKVLRSNNSDLFNASVKDIFRNSNSFIKYYNQFFSRTTDSKYSYYMDHKEDIRVVDSTSLYEFLCSDSKFNNSDLILTLCKEVPTYNGFDAADDFMFLFIRHFQEFDKETIKKVFSVYNHNSQFSTRYRHKEDLKRIREINETMEKPLVLEDLSSVFK